MANYPVFNTTVANAMTAWKSRGRERINIRLTVNMYVQKCISSVSKSSEMPT